MSRGMPTIIMRRIRKPYGIFKVIYLLTRIKLKSVRRNGFTFRRTRLADRCRVFIPAGYKSSVSHVKTPRDVIDVSTHGKCTWRFFNSTTFESLAFHNHYTFYSLLLRLFFLFAEPSNANLKKKKQIKPSFSFFFLSSLLTDLKKRVTK